jgi:inhibitor of KinA sporulation pathway (predicted exonuclease)
VIDVESTCWNNLPPNKFPDTRNEIIEIGLTSIELKPTYRILESRSILVKPVETEISEFCTELTTITSEMINRSGIKFEDAINILKSEYKSHRQIFASWGESDRKSFEKNCKWNNVSYPFSNLHLNVKTLFAAKFGYCGNLNRCCDDLGIEFVGTHHRGVDDSFNTAKILLSLLK